MSIPGIRSPILTAVHDRLSALYGDRLVRLALFGSRARGDHDQESDYDIAVFLRDYDLTMGEILLLADLSWDIQSEFGAIVSFKPFPAGMKRSDSELLREVERDGIAI